MNLNVVVLDYDGTIATDGVLHPDARSAIAELHAAGLIVVLATGRLLADLQQLLGDLRLFDAVIAENGAVIAFPDSGRSTTLGTPLRVLIDALGERHVPATAEECVVETDAEAAPAMLELVRRLELPLMLAFNRGRLMILPQGVSKATGLHEALRALRLSEHNVVAIGDAENDHALLDVCKLGVAVGWGNQATGCDQPVDGRWRRRYPARGSDSDVATAVLLRLRVGADCVGTTPVAHRPRRGLPPWPLAQFQEGGSARANRIADIGARVAG
jgi:soluble P-type ATPase